MVYTANVSGVTDMPTGTVTAGATSIALQRQAASGGGANALSDANFTNTSQIIFVMTYHV